MHNSNSTFNHESIQNQQVITKVIRIFNNWIRSG